VANIDFGRLLKILEMTASSHDGEALNAIRMANKILAEAKVSWAQIVANPVTYRTGGNTYTEEVFRGAAENVRRAREEARFNADFNTDNLRAKQAERDARWKESYDHTASTFGWTEKGPFDAGPRTYSFTPGEETPDPQVQIELDAEQLSHTLSDEVEQANMYVFAVVEPELAKYLHDNRDGILLARVMYKTVVQTGDISEQQKQVLRQLMKRSGGGKR
jgi:hypothetical protein